jgi:hypothetical protein
MNFRLKDLRPRRPGRRAGRHQKEPDSESLIHATVFTDYETEAKVAIDIISRYMIPMTLITSKNVDRFLEQ